jgi:hypothetical protein
MTITPTTNFLRIVATATATATENKKIIIIN